MYLNHANNKFARRAASAPWTLRARAVMPAAVAKPLFDTAPKNHHQRFA